MELGPLAERISATSDKGTLGVAIGVTQKFDITAGSYILDSVVYTVCSAIGFAVAICIFAGLREQLELVKVPKAMKGVPIALITAGILALAFMGFANLVPAK